MSYIYTHIWQNKNNHFYSEGICYDSYDDALNDLYDHLSCWLDKDNSYYCTYVDDLTSHEVKKINMARELGNVVLETNSTNNPDNNYNYLI